MDQSSWAHRLQTASFAAVAGHPFAGQGQSRLRPLNVQATLSSVCERKQAIMIQFQQN